MIYTNRVYHRFAEDVLSRFVVVPINEFIYADSLLDVIGLRHDVDVSLDMAMRMAEYESSIGIRSTYFILHTAAYYDKSDEFVDNILAIQSMGHEVGLHHEFVMTGAIGGSIVDSLTQEVEWLRSSGINVYGCAAHGSIGHRKHGYVEYDIWAESSRTDRDKNNRYSVVINGVTVDLRCCSLVALGLYEAYFIDKGYASDGRSLDIPESGHCQVLVHPCRWKI